MKHPVSISVLIYVLAVIGLVSCSEPFKENELFREYNSDPGDAKATVVWRVPSLAGSIQPMTERDGIIYFAAGDIEGFRTVNAATGAEVWRNTEYGSAFVQPVFFENGKLGYVDANTLYLFEMDGKLYRKILFGTEDTYRNSQMTAAGNRIYLAVTGSGLIMFDIETDVYETENGYAANVKQLYEGPPDADGDGKILWIPPVEKDGIVYSGVNPIWGKPGTFFAVNLETERFPVLWETKGKELRAWSYWTPEYRNGKLYILDPYGFGILDMETGKLLVDRSGEIAGGYETGGFFYNGKIYITNGSDPSNDEHPENVICVDQETGETVWAQSFHGSHGSNPVCHEGITYVASQSRLRILDAENGELLGEAMNVHGDEWQCSNVLKYRDTMIIKTNTELICVKLDFRTDGKGNLWKEK